MLTTEFIVAGILPDIAADLKISLADAGTLITVFAAGMVVGAPTMAMATRRISPRLTLILALLIFAAGHAIVALCANFTVLLAARFVTALATGAFWAVASVVAARLAPAGMTSRALGVVTAGGMLATVLGVPLGAFFAQLAGWRGFFGALGLLALMAAILIWRGLPEIHTSKHHVPLRAEFAALRSKRLWLALAACATTTGGVLAAYSYVSPLLIQTAGFHAGTVPWILAVFGIGSFIGTLLGGRVGDRHPHMLTVIVPAFTVLFLTTMLLTAHSPLVLVLALTGLGLVGLSANPVLISLALRYAKNAPTLGSALSVAAFNLGTMAASWFGGRSLESPLGMLGPIALGIASSVLTLIPVSVLAWRARTAYLRQPNAADTPAS